MLSSTSSLPEDSVAQRFEVDPNEYVSLIKNLRDTQSAAPLDEIGGIGEIIQGLQTDPEHGLGVAEIAEDFASRRNHFGDNRIPQPLSTSFCRIFLESFKDPMLIILIVMSIVSIGLEVGVPLFKSIRDPDRILEPGELPWYFGWVEGASILVAVAIIVVVSSANDWSKELKFRELAAEGDRIRISGIRDGMPVDVWVDDLVAGDVVILNTGDKVPADGLLLTSYDVSVKEGSVTGESDDVAKSAVLNPVVLSGTEVTQGTGSMVVVCVGEFSEWGRTMKEVKGKKKVKTPLETKLDSLAANVGYVGFGLAGLTLVCLIIGYVIKKFFPNTWTTRFAAPEACSSNNVTAIETDPHHCGSISTDLSRLVGFIITAVLIVVIAVPEGLPLAVTISLAYSVKKMLADKNLVRHLAACETMGGCTTICSDKTGTLTMNEMRVTKNWIVGKELVDGVVDVGHCRSLVVDSIACNSTANLVAESSEVQGSRTEGALLYFVTETLGLDFGEIRKVREHKYDTLKKFSFSSELKRMSCVVRHREGHQGRKRLFCKGASEVVLDLCDRVLLTQQEEDAEAIQLEDATRSQLREMIDEWASHGLRVLCLAYRDNLPEEGELEDRESLETELILYQIVGISDPLRPEVVDAVNRCRTAGILVRMVTGDNLKTAMHIAESAGLYDPDDPTTLAMEGPTFRNMSDDELADIVPRLRVLARSSPLDKLKLVEYLKEHYPSQVVAVTGDGTNDGPALRAADVGLSMGIAGTQVAKAASDIVLLDDNFASIVSAVIWGRSIYDNIRKFLQFQLSVNVVALVMIVTTALTQFASTEQQQLPFTAVQLLWVNLVQDTLAALALATEQPEGEVLIQRKPYSKTESLINWTMCISILVQSAYQLLVLYFLYYGGSYIWPFQVLTYGNHKTAYWKDSTYHFIPENEVYRSRVKNTLVFNTFVFLQIFNQLNCRRISLDQWNIFGNLKGSIPFIIIFSLICLIQLGIIEIGAWSGGYLVFQTTGQEPWAIGIAIVLGAGSIVVHYLKNLVCHGFVVLCCRKKKEKNGNQGIDGDTLLLSPSTPRSSRNDDGAIIVRVEDVL